MPEAERPANNPSVTYTNSRRDLLLYQWQMVFRARPNQLGFGLMIPATGLSVLVQMGPTPGGYLAAVVYMVLAIPVVLALVGLVFLIGMSRRANRSVLTRHTVTLDATGVLEETAYGRCEAYWTGVDRIVDSGGYVYVFTTQLGAHIIPAAAFAGAEQREAFVAYARQRLEQADAAAPESAPAR